MSRPKSTYTPLPEISPQDLPRLAAVIEAMAGLKTVSAAARSLGVSRNHFQSLLHRGIAALAQAVAVQKGGRPARPAGMTQLRVELRRLQRENRRLRSRVESTDRLLAVASGLLQGRIRTGRQRRVRSKTGTSRDGGEDSDPDGHRRELLAGADAMRDLNLAAPLVAAVAGVGASTLRRWRARRRRGTPLANQPQRGTRISSAAANEAALLVRRLRGLVGAESLGRSAGISRRVAARIKALTLTCIERERKVALRRVRITAPGVLRGMDALQFPAVRAGRYALISADGAVPFRTSLLVGARYDAQLAATALEKDIECHGAPLVYRLDRASAHDAPQARAVLAAHRVMPLHGPPRYPSYYGQLERQNREHRAWMAGLLPADTAELEACLLAMLNAVNGLWRRRTLNWQTAAEAWSARPPLNIDRQALHEEVQERSQRIACRLSGRGQPADLAERLAIEQTLTKMGYMRQVIGGWC